MTRRCTSATTSRCVRSCGLAGTYIARKSAVLQQVLAFSDLTAAERDEIRRLSATLPQGRA